jgi:hypothetical protein
MLGPLGLGERGQRQQRRHAAPDRPDSAALALAGLSMRATPSVAVAPNGSSSAGDAPSDDG